MYAQPTVEVDTVLAARDGDSRALEELVTSHLPLVYNIAGRALDGHADVDDVVQETMARMVAGLGGLRQPESFRSWLVAITMSQVRDWRRRDGSGEALLDEARGMADLEADFVGVMVMQLGLSGQRRETAEATRWLDIEDREVLSLWWLEVAGLLSRSELASGLGVTEQHAAVRVQRMKERLEKSRAVVRAQSASPRCGELTELTRGWNGTPSGLWRKRLSRHVQACGVCSDRRSDLVPAEGLLSGIGLVAIPAGLTLGMLVKGKTAVVGVAWTSLIAKPVVAAAVGATVIAGTTAVYTLRPAEPPKPRATPAVAASAPPARPIPTSPSPTSPSPTRSRAQSRYGQVVDAVDQAPPKNRSPARLPRRASGTLSIGGKHGYSRYGGAPQMTHRGDYITLTGKGYFQVRWGILYRQRIGFFPPATWTGLKGRLFHVASGGGRRMDDESSPGVTWMGAPDAGFVTLPKGQQQMWQNEFYYLNGSVTFHNNESGTDVDLSVAPRTWREIWADLTTRPDVTRGIIRFGLTRDTGDDRSPVPQYVTRSSPADPTDVRQRSRVQIS